MQFSFSKMNSQGNDFVIIDNTSQNIVLSEYLVRKISSDVTTSCDQILLIDVDSPINYLNINNIIVERGIAYLS